MMLSTHRTSHRSLFRTLLFFNGCFWIGLCSVVYTDPLKLCCGIAALLIMAILLFS